MTSHRKVQNIDTHKQTKTKKNETFFFKLQKSVLPGTAGLQGGWQCEAGEARVNRDQLTVINTQLAEKQAAK